MDASVSVALMGALQGLTEFLPVSSSGHLRLAEQVLRIPDGVAPLTLEVVLHAGTLGAVMLWLRRDVLRLLRGLRALGGNLLRGDRGLAEDSRLLLAVIVASVPTAILGLALKKAGVEAAGPPVVAAGLVITGVLDLLVRKKDAGDARGGAAVDETAPTLGTALVIGLAQGVAVLPGLSRSGSTIAAGCTLGLGAGAAARFSFLISLPAVGGATLLEAVKLASLPAGPASPVPTLVLGAAVAFVTGLAALRWLFAALDRGKFHLFGYYCFVVAALIVLSFLAR